MAKVYMLNNDGSTEAMPSIHCKNEDLELQTILELNPDLLPGDQINPSDPRHWLVVKREMPVPDPGTGDNRWSIDFFFVDQDAMPTFIECKRYLDTRAKREVVGQMLEYAANGHYYWSKEQIRAYAEQAAEKNGVSLEDEIRRLRPEESESIDAFFQQVQDNLREGQVRLIFFMEASPPELRSVVDFLNKQMERSEVLLVEARQYERAGVKIVTPILFGYTEEARQVKRTVSISSGQKRKWDKESFFSDAKERLSENHVAAIRKVFDKCQQLRCELSWGTGKLAGSFSAKWPHLGIYSLLSVFSDGKITISYGNFNKTPEELQIITFLKQALTQHVGLAAPDDYEKRYPNYQIDDWFQKSDSLLVALDSVFENFPIPESI